MTQSGDLEALPGIDTDCYRCVSKRPGAACGDATSLRLLLVRRRRGLPLRSRNRRADFQPLDFWAPAPRALLHGLLLLLLACVNSAGSKAIPLLSSIAGQKAVRSAMPK